MIRLDLECGRTVYVDAFYCIRTYCGLLHGKPDHNINSMYIEHGLNKAGSIWGPRKTYMIPPKMKNENTENPELPPLLWYVWLTCNKPLHAEYCGSELVVVFFSDYVLDRNIREIFNEHLLAIPWMEEARDFDP